MGMPLREYYSVVRAAELLGCKVDDLLHWASIGAIKLYVSFEEGRGYVRFIGDGAKKEYRILERFTEEQFESAQLLRDELFKEKYTIDKFSRVVSLMRCKNIDLDSLPCEERFYPCSFSGLWALPQNAYGTTVLYSFQPSMDDFWFSAESKMFVSFEMDEFLNLEVEDLYVSKSDFVKIRDCEDGDEFPSYINGKLKKLEASDAGNVVKDFSKGKESNKVHPTVERHSKNKLEVICAAFFFKEENEELFDEKCRHKNGQYNFSAWAREIKSREQRLFEKCKAPVKEDKMAEYISLALKSPHPNS